MAFVFAMMVGLELLVQNTFVTLTDSCIQCLANSFAGAARAGLGVLAISTSAQGMEDLSLTTNVRVTTAGQDCDVKSANALAMVSLPKAVASVM